MPVGFTPEKPAVSATRTRMRIHAKRHATRAGKPGFTGYMGPGTYSLRYNTPSPRMRNHGPRRICSPYILRQHVRHCLRQIPGTASVGVNSIVTEMKLAKPLSWWRDGAPQHELPNGGVTDQLQVVPASDFALQA